MKRLDHMGDPEEAQIKWELMKRLEHLTLEQISHVIHSPNRKIILDALIDAEKNKHRETFLIVIDHTPPDEDTPN